MQPLAIQYNLLAGGQALDSTLQSVISQVVAAMTAAFTEIKGATWSAATDTLEQIADGGGGGGGATPADIWAYAARTLTSSLDPNAPTIAAAVRSELATELSRIDVSTSSRLASAGYTAPLDAAATRSAIGLASANLDTQLNALPTASENADAVSTIDIDGLLTLKESLIAHNAALAGKMIVGGSTIAFRNTSDTKDVIVATMDAGSRSAIVLDVT